VFVHFEFEEYKEREGRILAVRAGREEVTVEAHSSSDGMLFLTGISVSGFRIVQILRAWDDPTLMMWNTTGI
jgi:hypothetical protein